MDAETSDQMRQSIARAYGAEDRAAERCAEYAPAAADDVLGGLLQRLRIDPASTADKPRCPELAGKETECFGGSHSYSAGRLSYHVRRCPVVAAAEQRRRIPAEAKALEALLAKCGYRPLNPHDRREVADVLIAALQERQEIVQVQELLGLVRHYRAHKLDRNVILHGPRGLGKTHSQLAIHFSQLSLGRRSRYLTSSALASIAKRRQSADPDTCAEAEQELRQLQAAEVLVWSDVADRNDHAVNLAATTQDMLEHFRGVICASTNLAQQELNTHVNVLARVTSRLFADHEGRSSIRIALLGPDQRTRAGRRHLRAVEGGER